MTVIVVVGVVLALFAIIASRPAAYHVEVAAEIATPRDRVFGVIDDLRQFADVLVLFRSPVVLDPSLQKSFAGPAAGVGQSFAWSGKQVGKATLTIDESVAGERVCMRLCFVAPMKSTARMALTLASTPTGSLVTWSMQGNHNFIGKAFGMFVNMNAMLGRDLEKSLARLKSVVESPALQSTMQACTRQPPPLCTTTTAIDL